MTANEYIKQVWLTYPTLYFSKFSVLHSIFGFGGGYEISNDGKIENVFHDYENSQRTDFKNDFQDYQTEIERKLILARQKLLLEYMDELLNEFLPIAEKKIGIDKSTYITNHYIFNVSNYSLFFNLNKDVRKDWLEAALEMGNYWIEVLHSWNYYHPTKRMISDMELIRDQCDVICRWVGRRTFAEQNKELIELLKEVIDDEKNNK